MYHNCTDETEYVLAVFWGLNYYNIIIIIIYKYIFIPLLEYLLVAHPTTLSTTIQSTTSEQYFKLYKSSSAYDWLIFY